MKGIGYLLLTIVLACYFTLTYRASTEECRTVGQILDRHDRLITYSVWTVVALGMVVIWCLVA